MTFEFEYNGDKYTLECSKGGAECVLYLLTRLSDYETELRRLRDIVSDDDVAIINELLGDADDV